MEQTRSNPVPSILIETNLKKDTYGVPPPPPNPAPPPPPPKPRSPPLPPPRGTPPTPFPPEHLRTPVLRSACPSCRCRSPRRSPRSPPPPASAPGPPCGPHDAKPGGGSKAPPSLEKVGGGGGGVGGGVGKPRQSHNQNPGTKHGQPRAMSRLTSLTRVLIVTHQVGGACGWEYGKPGVKG